MPLSISEIRGKAAEFAREWAGETRERAEAQTFWDQFFEVFGVPRRRVAIFEEPVKKLGKKRGSIDLIWKGVLVVEHKSAGEDLDSAYAQATDYSLGLKDSELPQYIVVSDFAQLRLYDLEEDTQTEFSLSEFPDKIHLFGFISGYRKQRYHDEDPVNIKVAEKMGELHDAMLDSGYEGHHLELYLVRLIYCLFADDTRIFNKDQFQFYIEDHTRADGSDTGPVVSQIFQVLNTPPALRHKTLNQDLRDFQYINGALFDETLPIPTFDPYMRQVLLECCQFDWSKVSPAIFGSLFQTVMLVDKDRRRSLGAHYTSEKNILKVIRGLFLDELWAEFESIKTNSRKLKAFHDKLARLRFFDPACGCGDFLVIAYREIRKLEIEVLKRLYSLTDALPGKIVTQRVTDIGILSKIDVDSLYGIEIEEFPARIAEVAIWITDHQMNMELSNEFGEYLARLPLSKMPHIMHGNALRLDWSDFIPQDDNVFVLGNPPFVGKSNRTPSQNEDMDITCKALRKYGTLDYVSAWYLKAVQFIRNTSIKVAFVSTSSITQGEQVGILWPHLLENGVKIHFAHRTFRWSNEARGLAHVLIFPPFGGEEVKT